MWPADKVGGTVSLPLLAGGRVARWIGVALALICILVAGRLAWPVFPVTALYTVGLLWRYDPKRDALWRPWIEGQGLVAGAVALLAAVCFGF